MLEGRQGKIGVDNLVVSKIVVAKLRDWEGSAGKGPHREGVPPMAREGKRREAKRWRVVKGSEGAP